MLNVEGSLGVTKLVSTMHCLSFLGYKKEDGNPIIIIISFMSLHDDMMLRDDIVDIVNI